MTTRKSKPRNPSQRKRTVPYDRAEYMRDIGQINDNFAHIFRRLEALETRKHFRDASHDEPVSNRAEAIGQSATDRQPSSWRRFLSFMDKP